MLKPTCGAKHRHAKYHLFRHYQRLGRRGQKPFFLSTHVDCSHVRVVITGCAHVDRSNVVFYTLVQSWVRLQVKGRTLGFYNRTLFANVVILILTMANMSPNFWHATTNFVCLAWR